MKLLKILFVGVVCFFLFNLISCRKECVADVAVTDLSSPHGPVTITSGDTVYIDCTIKNISCGTSNQGQVFIEMGFNPVFGATFSHYQVFDSFWGTLQSFASGCGQIDHMPMIPVLGAGYYSMKVTTYVSADGNSSNDAKAVAVRVDP